jgi:hypothetical protein
MRDPETSASNLSECDVRQKIGVNKCRWLLRPQAKCTSGQSTSPQRSAWQLHQNWTLVDDRVDNFLGRYRIEGAVHALQLVSVDSVRGRPGDAPAASSPSLPLPLVGQKLEQKQGRMRRQKKRSAHRSETCAVVSAWLRRLITFLCQVPCVSFFLTF